MTQGAQPPSPPSAIAWNWRRATSGGVAATERAAARRHGLIQGGIGLAVAAFLYWVWSPLPPWVPAVVAAIALLTLLLALAAPTTGYRQLTRAVDALAHAVGMTVTWVLMTLLYYLFFLPVGFFLRLGRKLGITTGFDPSRASYWSPAATPERTPESYRKQF
jgi:Flp pilus assembly protein TadB